MSIAIALCSLGSLQRGAMPVKPIVSVVTPSIDTRVGGVERFARSLEKALREDWSVELLSTGTEVPRNVARFGGRFLWESRAAARAVNSGGPRDLLITNGTLGWGSSKATPRIHVFHGTLPGAMRSNVALPMRERLRSAAGGGLAEYLSARNALTVAVSRSAAEEVGRTFGIHVDRVIENGVDCELFRPRDRAEGRARLGLPQDGRLALFVGRAEPRKGADIAARAAELAGFQLAVAGARPISGAVHLGLLSPESLAWAYSAADCVVFPTRYEACSYVVLEALASGVPLVTTPVGWARDLGRRVPDYRQLLAPPDAPAIAGAMRRSLEDVRSATAAARELVISHNSLQGFEQRWREMALIGGRRAAAST